MVKSCIQSWPDRVRLGSGVRFSDLADHVFGGEGWSESEGGFTLWLIVLSSRRLIPFGFGVSVRLEDSTAPWQ